MPKSDYSKMPKSDYSKFLKWIYAKSLNGFQQNHKMRSIKG